MAIAHALEGEFRSENDLTWWVYVLVYSGARPEEIAQLDRQNVRREQCVWGVDINEEDGRKTKNQNSWRIVPVHPSLIERGFIKYATEGNGDHVFSSFDQDTKGYFGVNEARRFMRFLRGRMGITDPRKVLYSVRHSFHTAMRSAGAPYAVQLALVGRMEDENLLHDDTREGAVPPRFLAALHQSELIDTSSLVSSTSGSLPSIALWKLRYFLSLY